MNFVARGVAFEFVQPPGAAMRGCGVVVGNKGRFVAMSLVCRARFASWSPIWSEWDLSWFPVGKGRIASSDIKRFPAR